MCSFAGLSSPFRRRSITVSSRSGILGLCRLSTIIAARPLSVIRILTGRINENGTVDGKRCPWIRAPWKRPAREEKETRDTRVSSDLIACRDFFIARLLRCLWIQRLKEFISSHAKFSSHERKSGKGIGNDRLAASQDTCISRKDTLCGDRERENIGLTAKVHVFRTCTGYMHLCQIPRRELAFRGQCWKTGEKDRVLCQVTLVAFDA